MQSPLYTDSDHMTSSDVVSRVGKSGDGWDSGAGRIV